jgi:hypothetical protein
MQARELSKSHDEYTTMLEHPSEFVRAAFEALSDPTQNVNLNRIRLSRAESVIALEHAAGQIVSDYRVVLAEMWCIEKPMSFVEPQYLVETFPLAPVTHDAGGFVSGLGLSRGCEPSPSAQKAAQCRG